MSTTREMRETISALEIKHPGWSAYTGPGAGGHTNHGITLRSPDYPDDVRHVRLLHGREVHAIGPAHPTKTGPTGHPRARDWLKLSPIGGHVGRGWRTRVYADVVSAIKWLERRYPFTPPT